jgi:hypothetical protein
MLLSLYSAILEGYMKKVIIIIMIFIIGDLLTYNKVFANSAAEGPVITDVFPADNATNVEVWKNSYGILFKENVRKGRGFKNITINSSKGGRIACLRDNVSACQVNIDFGHEALETYTTYTINIPKDAIEDERGNDLGKDYEFSFKTGPDTFPPRLNSIIPQNGTKDISVSAANRQIRIYFDDFFVPGEEYNNITLKDPLGNIISIKKEIEDYYAPGCTLCGAKYDGHYVDINPETDLHYATSYTITLPKGAVKDKSGNKLREGGVVTFTTEKQPIPPYITKINPQNQLSILSKNNNISISFSTNVYSSTGFENIRLLDSNGNNYTCLDKKINNGGIQISFRHEGELKGNSKYTLVIPKDAVKDGKGLSMNEDYKMKYETDNDNAAPTLFYVTSDSNHNDMRTDLNNIGIMMQFSDNVIVDERYNEIFLKDNNNKSELLSIEYQHRDVCKECKYRTNDLILKPSIELKPSTQYSFIIPAGSIKDLSGNLYMKDIYSSFKTTNILTGKYRYLDENPGFALNNGASVQTSNKSSKIILDNNVSNVIVEDASTNVKSDNNNMKSTEIVNNEINKENINEIKKEYNENKENKFSYILSSDKESIIFILISSIVSVIVVVVYKRFEKLKKR